MNRVRSLSTFANPSRALSTRLGVALVLTASGCTPETDAADVGRIVGAVANVGAATASAYAEFSASNEPTAIGLAFSENFFDELPTDPSDRHRCFDRDGNGTVEQPAECNAWHEWVIPLPSQVASRADIPFKWSLLNWNPIGHIPPGVYDVPHFDIHFYIAPIEDVFALQPGPCGPEFIRCDQFETGRKPLPPNYLAPDYEDVEAVAPAMGNHLIDLTSPEFQGEPFTRTWIYGIYDGRVTYYEEMVTRAFLLDRPSECFDIKSAPAVGLAGFYPTVSCLRYNSDAAQYTVSMERFVYREASPPEPPRAGASSGAGARD